MEPKKANDPDQLGDWRINGRLGEGGFGTVFLAEKGAQKAAIKVIRQEFVQEEDARRRLVTEAEILSKLSDPSIGKILDSDLNGELPWIATEFINGPTLQDKIKYEGPLKEIEWFNLAANLFHAIVTANKFDIIHKDIKPSNIILGETGNKLIDFGIAHITGQTRTANFGDREGSTPFSSPEHFTIKPNPKMDVFSTAATLAYAAKGKSIWNGDNDLQLMRSINEDEPNLEGLSENQGKFLRPLLEKNPSDRPSALEAHQSALGYIEFLLGKRKKPSPLKSPSRLKKLFRSKVAITGLALGLITGVGFTASLAGFPLMQTGIESLINNDSVDFTDDQIEKISSCKNLVALGNYASAAMICKETAELGDDWSQYSLGFALDELGQSEAAKDWVLKAAKQKMPEAISWMAYDAMEEEDYPKALEWAKQAANFGDLPGVHAVGLAYGNLGQYDLAAQWYEKAWQLGDALGLINLGYHYRFDSVDKIKAEKWLKLAAQTSSTYKPEGAYDYAEFLRDEGRKASEFCPYYKESADAKYKDDDLDADAVAAFKKYCSDPKLFPQSVASPAEKKSIPSPVENKKSIPSSDTFKISAPIAPGVQVDEIFGRAFKSGLDWKIPLTNVKGEKVPELTAIQFRMIGYANAGWMDVPYKLKNDSSRGTVNAEVDDLLFALVFKEVKYCPEFRAVREEGGKVVNIWNKGQPECASDYNP
jgi:serine/threonine protein kinase